MPDLHRIESGQICKAKKSMSTLINILLEAAIPKGLFAKSRRLASKLAFGGAGGLMVETVVAVSLMTVTGTAVLSGLSTTHISGAQTERQSVAENIARNQMAAVFDATYETNGDSYVSITLPPEYSGYSVTADSEEVDPLSPDPCVQKVVVEVFFEGKLLMTLESIKVNETDSSC